MNNTTPNFTQIPNVILDEWMKKLSDTELRLVLIIARQTFGWIADRQTGMRKQEDWIAHSQLIEKTGRSGRAISTAIDMCIQKGIVEARDRNGDLLDTKEKRARRRVFYRIKTSAEEISVDQKAGKSAELFSTSAENTSGESAEKSSDTKETPTKETKTKLATIVAENGLGKNINLLLEEFRHINPNYENLFTNKSERKALAEMIMKYGLEKMIRLLNRLPSLVEKPYAPRITTPITLQRKLGELVLFMKQEQGKGVANGNKAGVDASHL